MSGDDRAAPHPIIVVRRRRGEGEGHHGGVWKIAYADFMTAMMAFFLVMWLINMTDDKTIVQVAAYFNPLRLSDRVPSDRGIYDGTTRANKKSGEGAEGTSHESSQEKKKQRELDIFSDVKAMLDDLAAKAAMKMPPGPGPGAVAGADVTRSDAPLMRDPFDPARHAQGPSTSSETGAPSLVVVPSAKLVPPAEAPANKVIEPGKADAASDGAAGMQEAKAISEQATRLKEAIASVQQQFSGKIPDIEVKATAEGVLVSMTDKSDVSMFSVGSAEPTPEAVVLIERVGAILKEQGSTLIVRGHTDGRAYRSAAYDNWRLSSARAHMTYHMLLRGGVSETRFAKIEGYADRDPRVPGDVLAAQNRRIEVLLRVQP